MDQHEVATADHPEWKQLSSAPRGVKCLLLTENGLAVVGILGKDTRGYLAWSPLPKKPVWLKQLEAQRWTRCTS